MVKGPDDSPLVLQEMLGLTSYRQVRPVRSGVVSPGRPSRLVPGGVLTAQRQGRLEHS